VKKYLCFKTKKLWLKVPGLLFILNIIMNRNFFQARFLLSKVNPSQTHNNMYAYGGVSWPYFYITIFLNNIYIFDALWFVSVSAGDASSKWGTYLFIIYILIYYGSGYSHSLFWLKTGFIERQQAHLVCCRVNWHWEALLICSDREQLTTI